MGIALAFVCATMGLKLIAVMPENMSVELNEKKIYVVLPQEQHGIYRSMGHSRSAQKAMHAMIFVPALMSVFEELRRRLENTGDFADLSEYQWIRALEKVAEKRFNKTLEELLLAKEPLELSQMFLKNPRINHNGKEFFKSIYVHIYIYIYVRYTYM